MNTKLILLAISVAAFSSCTTLYKSGQTPDDVYFSPTRLSGGDVEVRREQQRDEADNYTSEYRSVRLGINDRRWRYLDYNYSSNPYINDYSYTPYNYGYNYGYYYNPYFYPYPVYSNVFNTPSLPKNTTPRMANLSTYNPIYNNSRSYTPVHGATRPARAYNNNNRGSAVGNVMRQVFSPSNSNSNSSNNNSNNNNNNSSNNTRSYTPSSSSSSSSSSGSSSSGSGGGVSRPPRN